MRIKTGGEFKYASSIETDVTQTWRRHGFKPTSESERIARQQRTRGDALAPPITFDELAARRALKQKPQS